MERIPSSQEASWLAVGEEISRALEAFDPASFEALIGAFETPARRWFFSGQGRSGLVARMAAMRFMHAGFDSHFVGEATAPSVRDGDALVIVSGSGETPVSLSYARIAKAEGARVIALVGREKTALASLADTSVSIPLPETRQFGGSLFEQTSLILLDAAILRLTGGSGETYEAMTHRHTNLQ